MSIDPDNIEEAKELLEYALENRRWIEVEEAIEILKEALGYDIDDDSDEENE